jgi:hypothetical protein
VFPFANLRTFRSVGSTLESLPSGVFGGVKFQMIDVSDSSVRMVDGDVLDAMSDRLEQFIAPGNRLHSFPFGTIANLQKINVLDLSRNFIEHVDQASHFILFFFLIHVSY